MKRYLVLIFAAVLCLSALFGCSSVPAGYLEYDNRNAEFYIIYPEEWEMRSYSGTVVNFFSPAADAEDFFFENVSVVTVPLVGVDIDGDGKSDKITLDWYVDYSQSELSNYITDYKEISREKISMSDVEAYRVQYVGKVKESGGEETAAPDSPAENGQEGSENTDNTDDADKSDETVYKWTLVTAIHDEVAYILTFTGTEMTPQSMLDKFDVMIKNCKLG